MRIEASYRSLFRRTLPFLRSSRSLSSGLFGGLCGLFVCAALCAGESPPADPIPDGDVSPIELAELPVLWQAQRNEIATSQVRFRCFNSSFENSLNTPEHVAQLLATHDLVTRPEELHAFLEAFTGREFDEWKPWDDMVLTISGSRRRVDGRFCQFVTDGDLEAVLTPTNHQLDLQPAGKSTIRHYQLADLRRVPSPRVSTSAWQYLRTLNGAAVFNVPPAEDGPDFEVLTSVDPASGIVTHSITRHPDGTPAIEMYQSGLEVHASGVVFPRVRIDLTYSHGAVYTARIMLVQQATFNESISDEAFVLTAPAGTRIVDYRVPDKDVWIETEPVADALALPVRKTPPTGRPIARIARPVAADRWWWLLAGVHLAGVAAAVLLLWRRRRTMLSRTPTSPN